MFVSVVPPAAAADAQTPQVTATGETLLLGKTYPIEVRASFPGALLHWLDSLGELNGRGTTAGKTARAHRMDYEKAFGKPTLEDLAALREFARVRQRYASRASADPLALTEVFFEASTLELALERSRELLGRDEHARFRGALEHFTPRYSRIWNDARLPRKFLGRVRRDPNRIPLALFLRNVARFYGVSVDDTPAPRLVLTPVRDGYGTHAQAVRRYLLVEIREWEGLTDEVEPIVHENAHFLFLGTPAERRNALRAAAAAHAPGGLHSWRRLLEALPTAIGQGVAGERFRGKRWSAERPWYHRGDIDRYAKAIFPLVRETLAAGGSFDEAFVRRLVALDPSSE